ncbi:hypothetical protein PINS_up007816 [Pythium insidiosum]|nr:hypothetical protein PINS_up007816 [Pythium insidiosum]
MHRVSQGRAQEQRRRRQLLVGLAAVTLATLYVSHSLLGPSEPAWKPVAVLQADDPSLSIAKSVALEDESEPSTPDAAASNERKPDISPHTTTPASAVLDDTEDIHIIFSQSCDQHRRIIQQTVLQYTATLVGQRSPITQIIAGCTEEQRAKVMQEPTFYHDFRRHFTPNYAPHPEPGVDDWYTPYNKPYSLRHFLKHADPPITNKYIALVDGDFAFFHRLQINTGRNVSQFYFGSRDPATVNDTVKDGLALSMNWGMYGGLMWYKEPDKVKGMCGSGPQAMPCAHVSVEDAMEYYEDTASPYILTVNDLRKMIDDYCLFTVAGRKLLSNWVIEMEAYTFATANHGILHTKLHNYAISLPPWKPKDEEYWWFVDEIPHDVNPCDPNTEAYRPPATSSPLYFFHYFHLYRKEKYAFYKTDIPESLSDCDSPLLQLPPADEWIKSRDNPVVQYRQGERRHLWAQCSLIKLHNQAMLAYKKATCPNGYNTDQVYPMTHRVEKEKKDT